MLSGATLNSSLAPLNPLKKYVVVVSLLSGSSITVPVDGKTKVFEIEQQVISALQIDGLKDEDCSTFSLAIPIDESEYFFLEGDKKISKYCSRQWKTANCGQSLSGHSVLHLEYRVKYYLDKNVVIKDSFSKQYYYRQLRKNLLTYGQFISEENLLQLVSLSLQADLGDFDASVCSSGQYFECSLYFPQWFISEHGETYCFEKASNCHSKLKGLLPLQCYSKFIYILSNDERSAHCSHLYKLKKRKHDLTSNVAMSIGDSGIRIYDIEEDINSRPHMRMVQSFIWANIEDLSFDKKKFEIRAICYPGKLTLYASSDDKSKHLFSLCRQTHTHHSCTSNIRQTQLSSSQLRISSCDDFSSISYDSLPLLNKGLNNNEPLTNCHKTFETGQENILFGNSKHSKQRISNCTKESTTLNNISTPKDTNGAVNGQTHAHWDDIHGDAFERSESFRSSSSQHSTATVRCHYSRVPSRHCHELALGAQLADLTLAPDLPDLADLPAMASDLSSRRDDVAENSNNGHNSVHNCCSTCCNDDTASLGSNDEEPNEVDEVSQQQNGKCANEDNSVRSIYSYGTEGNSCLSENRSYEEPHYEQEKKEYSSCGLNGRCNAEDIQNTQMLLDQPLGEDVCDHASYKNIYNDSYSEVQSESLKLDGSAALMSDCQSSNLADDEQSLDYSVESAQEFLSPYFNSNYNSNYSSYLSEFKKALIGQKELGLAPVSMSKVTSVAPLSLVSSKCDFSSSSLESKMEVMSYDSAEHQAKYTTASNTSEAPAKFITSKPKITVLKAHTQLASTAAPSFSSLPLTRSKINSFQSDQLASNKALVQSLQRNQLPNPKPLSIVMNDRKKILGCKKGLRRNLTLDQVPIVGMNNYLDVHASSKMTCSMDRQHVADQIPVKSPRSLYLKNQRRKLVKQTLQNKYQYERFHDQLLNESVHQPAAYAQVVGVPLLPCPTLSGRQVLSSHGKHSRLDNDISSSHLSYSNTSDPTCPCFNRYSNRCYINPVKLDSGNAMSSDSYFSSAESCNYCINSSKVNCSSNSYDYIANLNNESSSLSYNYVREPCKCCRKKRFVNPSMTHQCANHVTQHQIEQFKAQLNSDTDYVIYPHKDPAISRQEYMDAKQSQVIATQTQRDLANKFHVSSHSFSSPLADGEQNQLSMKNEKSTLLYKSSPDVAGLYNSGSFLSSYPSYLSLASQNSIHQPGSSSGYSSIARGHYFSQQSLASSFSSVPSSSQSLTGGCDPYTEVPGFSLSAAIRAHSDESILSSTTGLSESDLLSEPQYPTVDTVGSLPYRPKSNDDCKTAAKIIDSMQLPEGNSETDSSFVLQQVRERCSHLDAPLLAALCSDASLFAETSCSSESTCASSLNSTNPSRESSSCIQSSTSLPPNGAFFPWGKYSLSGIFTTNQVPVPKVQSKQSTKESKLRNAAHQHPKFKDNFSSGQSSSSKAVCSTPKVKLSMMRFST